MNFKSLVSAFALAASTFSAPLFAADYSDGDIHKNDYKWMTVNLMHGVNNRIPGDQQDDTYLEIEFGGRNGIVDLYGYVDVFDITDDGSSDRDGSDNFFMKFAPRFSLDAITGTDLSFGPVKELYIATVTNVADNGAFGGLFEHYVGLGSDVEVPWLGKIGLNAYARYVRENYGASDEKTWDGYQLSTNWFKPVKFFDDGAFVAYQGYADYKFGADKIDDEAGRSGDSFEWFNGVYYHTDQWAFGYGLKYYRNFAFFEDDAVAFGDPNDSTGFGHYFSINYKF